MKSKWHPPETEEAWQECLSAYLDDELADEERRALEDHLSRDEARAAQLETLRRASGLLRAWQVEAPEPDPSFRRNLEKTLGERTRIESVPEHKKRSAGAFLRLALRAALFAAGVLTGVAGTLLIGERPDSRRQEIAQVLTPSSPTVEIVAENLSIAPSQAERLLRAMQANGMKAQVVKELQEENWTSALGTAWELYRKHGDELSPQDFPREELRRLMEKQYLKFRRI